MKVAGRKNDGAWYRVNKWLRSLRENGQESFLTDLKADVELLSITEEVRGVMNNLAGSTPQQFQAAMVSQALPATTEAQLESWIFGGFPRQVYLGKLSFDRYVKVLPGATFPGTARENDKDYAVFAPQNEQAMRDAGARLRKRLRDHMLVNRQLQDIANVNRIPTNPGGVADATVDPQVI